MLYTIRVALYLIHYLIEKTSLFFHKMLVLYAEVSYCIVSISSQM